MLIDAGTTYESEFEQYVRVKPGILNGWVLIVQLVENYFTLQVKVQPAQPCSEPGEFRTYN